MSGAKSRRKGATAERELCGMLRDNIGGEFSRNLKQYQKSQEGDIEQLVGPYLIECKNHATLNLGAWWIQTITAADKKGAIPCLAYKITRAGWRFVVPMPDAWASGHQWGRELKYTQTMYPEGFYLLIREL
jgi:Holliday junction resolvase